MSVPKSATNSGHAAALALDLIQVPQEEQIITVRPVRTDGELERVWELDMVGYGPACLAFDTLTAWWDAFPLGIWAAFQGPHAAGGVGLWPLPTTVGEQFRQGFLAEQDIPPDTFSPFTTRPAACWYVSGLVVAPAARRTPLVKTLLAGSLIGWIQQCHLDFPMRVLALAQSESGRLLLERCTFTCDRAGQLMPDGFPLYRLDVPTHAALVQLLRRRFLLPKVFPHQTPLTLG